MRTAIPFSLIALAIGSPATAQLLASANEAARIEARVDSVLQRYVDLGVFSGSVLLARDGRILLDKGYGFADIETRRKNDGTTRFRIGSISKQITESAIAQLMAQGLLGPEMRVSDVLPEYRHGHRLTIQQLVEHRGGVPHINELPWYQEASRSYHSPDQLFALFQDDSLDFEPGTRIKYSNGGFVLLARAIERVTGLAYGEYMRQHVFARAGMTRSGHEVSADRPRDLATGYTIGLQGLEESPDVDMSIKIGGGSLYATTGDLYRWARSVRSGRLADPKIMESLWASRGGPHPHFYAGGHSPGFTATLLQFKDADVTVIVLANHYGRTTDDIAMLLAGEAFGERYTSGVERYLGANGFSQIAVDDSALVTFGGRYQQRGPNVRFSLAPAQGTLVYELENHHTRYRLIPLSSTEFVDPLLWGVLRLTSAADGVQGSWEWFDYPTMSSTVRRIETN